MMCASRHNLKVPYVIPLLLLMVALLPTSAFAAELPTTEATISIENKLSGDKPSTAETFTFMLTPENASCPMPEGVDGGKIVISGAGTASFGAITYSEPNTYTYTVQETPGNAANYSYDKTVYNVTVYVTTDDAGSLTTTVWVTKVGGGEKSENAAFTNSYTEPAGTTPPKTGDASNLALWIVWALVSATVLGTITLYVGHRNKKGGERE